MFSALGGFQFLQFSGKCSFVEEESAFGKNKWQLHRTKKHLTINNIWHRHKRRRICSAKEEQRPTWNNGNEDEFVGCKHFHSIQFHINTYITTECVPKLIGTSPSPYKKINVPNEDKN